MSLYIAQKLSNSTSAHAAFSFRGIQGYTQAVPSTLHVVGIAEQREAAYAGYKENIDIFILANNIGKSIRLDSEGGLAAPKGYLPLPIGPLVFSVAPSLKMTTDQEDRLVGMLGQAVKEKSGKVTKFTLPEVSAPMFDTIAKFANKDYGVGRKEINMKGADLAFTLSFLIVEFLATNTYSAFREGGEDPEELDRYGEIRGVHGDERTGSGTDAYGWSAEEVSIRLGRKKQRLMEKPEIERTDEDLAELEELTRTKRKQKGLRALTVQHTRDAVWIARPKRNDPKMNYGPVASIPACSGLTFPYFEGMNAPDPATFRTAITSFFFRCLGKDLDTIKDRMHELRTGVGNLASTDIGMAMAHMLTGIRLTLETQTRLYLVIEAGQYKGFVLLGFHFSIFDTTRWLPAVSAEELRSHLTTFDTHSANLMLLCEALSGMSVIGADDIKEVRPDEIKRASDLVAEIRKRKIEVEEEQEERLNLALRGLYFGTSYKTPSVDSITWLLENLLLDDTLPDPDLPTYLYQIKGDYANRTYRFLLTFGPESPVPVTQTGGEYSIPEPSKEDPIYEPKEGKPLDALVFYLKAPHVAQMEWSGLVKKRMVRMNIRERSGPYKAIFLKEQKVKVRVWKALRELAWKKRQMEEPKLPEAKRPRVESVDALFSLFST